MVGQGAVVVSDRAGGGGRGARRGVGAPDVGEVTVKVSSASTLLSPLTETLTVWLVWPAAKLTVLARAV